MAKRDDDDGDDKTPPPTQYKGPTGAIRNSTWLTNEDLPHDRDTLVTIEAVHERKGVKFQGGRKKPRAFSLKFAGKDRELLVNATHKRTLNGLTGKATCGAWYGLQVYLFVEQDVQRPDGTIGPAVRIRAKRVVAPEPGAAGASSATPTDGIDADFDAEAKRAEGAA